MINIIEKLHKKKFDKNIIDVVAVITNNKKAYGIQRVCAFNIKTVVVDHKRYPSRELFDKQLVKEIDFYDPDLVVLAGFMRILTPYFTKRISAINLHPSILPHFKGSNAIEQSYKNSDFPAGVSTHWVSEELDAGEIILQREIERKQGETFDSFKEKIRQLEHDILPKSIIKVLKSHP